MRKIRQKHVSSSEQKKAIDSTGLHNSEEKDVHPIPSTYSTDVIFPTETLRPGWGDRVQNRSFFFFFFFRDKPIYLVLS